MGLSGPLPVAIGNLTELQSLSLRFNSLTGQVPSDFTKLTNLRNLYLQGNRFSGPIPEFLFSLQNLIRLNLAKNNFSGPIPSTVNNLTRLGTLFLEENHLTGTIPDLTLPSLQQFNVSFNNLTGRIPKRVQGMDSSAFIGNSLCGKPLVGCAGDDAGGKKKGLSGGAIAGIVIGSVVGLLLLLLILFCLCRRKRGSKPTQSSKDVALGGGRENEIGASRDKNVEESEAVGGGGLAAAKGESASRVAAGGGGGGGSKSLVFFGKGPKVFDLEDLLRASAEVLGKGTFGTAYKATLETGLVVAVKRLKDVTVSEKEFREKMEVVGSMEHENLVPLRAYYFSRDEKLLVYDYMPMGSLSALLHGIDLPFFTLLFYPSYIVCFVNLSKYCD